MPSGSENLTSLITGCRALAQGLEKAPGQGAAWKAKAEELLKSLEGMQGKFFFKTIPSVPPTKATLAALAECQGAKDKAAWKDFPTALANFEKSVADLAYKATMPGTQIT